MPLLAIDGLHAGYGSIRALRGISLAVDEGEIVTLIGANGAGKSTLLRTISGLIRPRQGSIAFAGHRLDRIEAHQIVALGVCQAPEGRRIFPRMTVRENLEMGAFTRRDKHITEDLERVLALFPRLAERLDQIAGTMSGGEQQMLAIGRALMARPRLLLLDEPSMGLAPILVDTIFAVIREINRQGTTILLVEQNAHMALATAARGYVLQSGEIILGDASAALRENAMVREAYLGHA